MSWYRTGTINLTKNSAIVTGVNTKWAQAVNGVMSGMIMILPDNNFYEIKNVVSDTSLVLVTAYSGATAAAQNYAVVTTYEGDLSQFSARFSALLTAMGGSRADLYNWLTSTAATITISKDDGTTVPVKTLKAFTDDQGKFATKNAQGVIPMDQGGTGAKDAAGIRQNAGLSANSQVGFARVTSSVEGDGFVTGTASRPNGASPCRGTLSSESGMVMLWRKPTDGAKPNEFLGISDGGTVIFRRAISATEIQDCQVYHTGNTARASDGTLKAASPVVKIFHNGRAETNDESKGCAVQRLDVGQYLVTGCIGLNSDAGWGGINGGFDIPKDRNDQPLIWLDYEVNADGSVLVKTYHRTYPDAPEFAQNNIDGIEAGEPVDIPADQFVSVRVEMPVDSIWNQKMAATQAESEVLQPENQEE